MSPQSAVRVKETLEPLASDTVAQQKNIISRSESLGRAGATQSSRRREGFNDTMNHSQRRTVTPILHPHPEITEEIKNVLMFFNTGEARDGKPDVLSRWSEGCVTGSNTTTDGLPLNLT